MNKRILKIIFLLLLIQISCDTAEENFLPFSTDPCELLIPTPDGLRYEAIYAKPIFIQPNKSIFYSSESVDIKWSLPSDLWNTELQMIQSDEPYDCIDYEKFHQLNNNISFGYGNQYVHYYTTTEKISPVQDSIYVSYRARTHDIEMVQGYSKWTDVKTFTVVPLSKLKKEIVTASYTLNFTIEELNHYYYSGVVTTSNYRLPELAIDNNINFDKIRLIRIVNFEVTFKTQMEEGQNPFSRLLIGFNEDINPDETVYPFGVIGDIYPGSFEASPIPGTLYDNLNKNLTSDLNNYDLKVAYALEDVVGSQHEMDVYLTFEIYSEN